ncbi:MarR family transcriptional regulator [Barrientosiimonas marina]|uniref:MarR family winged helix-turn-helix transcriptional regulator n=1 Tax=Lentibacillus kimchii TaxID=1542911 RepID=A0ABW2UUS5_9BACI
MESASGNDEKDLSLKCFVVLSRASHAVMEQDRQNIKQYGLYPAEFGVLELLHHKGEQAIQQIGKKILLTSGSITYVIDKLEKKGFLERKPSPEDRRVTYASITEQGEMLMNNIFPKQEEAVNDMFSALTYDEKHELKALLKKLGLSQQA